MYGWEQLLLDKDSEITRLESEVDSLEKEVDSLEFRIEYLEDYIDMKYNSTSECDDDGVYCTSLDKLKRTMLFDLERACSLKHYKDEYNVVWYRDEYTEVCFEVINLWEVAFSVFKNDDLIISRRGTSRDVTSLILAIMGESKAY